MIYHVFLHIFHAMKKTVITILVLFFSFHSFSKEKNEKVFLIIFNQEELQELNSSAAHIELNFLDKFQTRSYSGNSDAALLITVPFSDWTVCEMGKALVEIGKDDRLVPLENVAFRIIDMAECSENFQALVSLLNAEKNNNKKRNSTFKVSL